MGYAQALPYLEYDSARFCVPSINVDGSVRAGEPDTCYKLGDVNSSLDDIQNALNHFECNKCRLEHNLSIAQADAIGVTRFVTLK